MLWEKHRRGENMIRIITRCTLVSLLIGGIAACGNGGEESAQQAAGAKEAAGAPQAAQSAGADESPTPPATSALDPKLATRGEGIFKQRGCVACHTIGRGRLVGPDLRGVTDRREPGWIRAMVLNPDSMLKNDPTAKGLFATYMTPMANQKVTGDEVEALIAYLQRESESDVGP